MPNDSSSRRGLLATVLKSAFAVAVIAWLVWSGRLDMGQIARAWSRWPVLVAIGGLFYLQIAVMAWRWRRLSAALGFGMSGGRAFSLTMIGMLFNVAIPGAVSGDLVKAYYAAGDRRLDASGRFASIVVDRVVGLFSLIAMAVCGAAWNSRALAGNSALRDAWWMLVLILGCAAAMFAFAIVISGRLAGFIRSFPGRLPLRSHLSEFLDALGAYQRRPLTLLSAFLLSVPCHISACVAFHLAWRAVSPEPVSPAVILFIVPVGLTTTALPLTPAGIGVGQAAFYALFTYVMRGHGTLGATAFTMYQLVLILVSISGAFFYLRYSRQEPDRAAAAAGE